MVVPIVLLPPRALAEENEEEDEPHYARSPGSYDDQQQTIYIQSTLSNEEKWRVLRHELLHVLADLTWQDCQQHRVK